MLFIHLFASANEIRVVENNDWVIFSILGCVFLLAFMLQTLNREASLREFVLQTISEASNLFQNWLITSIVFVLLISVFVSQYVPIIPKEVAETQIMGLTVNKFGYTILVFSAYYIVKTGLSYIFYASIGNAKRWQPFYFFATKFYFIYSIVLMVACITHYYFLESNTEAMRYELATVGILFILKIFMYLFNKNNILPNPWYYKILYICTLQIIPVLVLWKLLFF